MIWVVVLCHQLHTETGNRISNLKLNFYRFLKATVCCYESVLSTRTSYEFVHELSENKVQLMRIRDEKDKFRSNSVSILNVTLA